MKNDNFCNWADANNFMIECDVFAGGITGLVDITQRLESPLEVVMLSAIMAAEKSLDFGADQRGDFMRLVIESRKFKFSTKAAVPIGTYRADLVVEAITDLYELNAARVVVECDGFNFHDRTRDQACRDRARDRYMQREGYVIARFAGDEIVERPFECAFDVYDLILRNALRVQRDAHPAGGWPIFTRGHDGQNNGPMSLEEFTLAVASRMPIAFDEVSRG